MSTISLTHSKVDAQNWYQRITLTLENNGDSPLDLNQAAISFTASGYADPWGLSGGTLQGNLPLAFTHLPEDHLEANEVVINNIGELWLAPGTSGTLFFNLAATQIPLNISAFTLTLAAEKSADGGEPLPEEPEEQGEPKEPEEPEEQGEREEQGEQEGHEGQEEQATPPTPDAAANDSNAGEGATISVSNLNSQSWYQRVAFSVTNAYTCAVDLNQLQISFTASGHPDPYSQFSGSLAGNQPVELYSDGGWPLEKNRITIHNTAPLMLAAGKTATLDCYMAATQTPVTLTDLTVVLAHDPGRQGKIILSFPQLSGELQPVIELTYPNGTRKCYSGRWGEKLVISDLAAGQYTVVMLPLQNDRLQITPTQASVVLTLASAQDVQEYSVAYPNVDFFARAELSLASPGLSGGEVNGELRREDGSLERNIVLVVGETLTLERLISGRNYEVRLLPTLINNQQITTPLNPDRFRPQSEQVARVNLNYQLVAVEATGFVEVKATVLGLPQGTAAQRYRLWNSHGQYLVELDSDGSQQTLPFTMAVGQYQVSAADVQGNGEYWRLDNSAALRIVQSLNVITLNFEKGIPLRVRGWPDYLAHGGVTVNAADTVSRYRDVPVSALFKYDGFDGGGDPLPAAEVDRNGDGVLDYDSLPIHKTAPLTRDMEKEAGRTVMPVMVVYTANASGGSALADLQDKTRLRNHFGNFITQCLAAQSYKDAQHPVPATFVLNPDFLGAIQQEPGGYRAVRQKNSIPVNEQLAAAIALLGSVPGFRKPELPTFSDDLYGYIQAVNYLVRQFAPDVAFGWQTNVWSTGTADWVLRDNADPLVQGKTIADFINELGVYHGSYAPDFIAFDKFERDCFSPDARAHYSWNATCWLHYLGMVKQVTKGLLRPAMLWQIPGGHMPTVEEGVSRIAAAHFASGGTFFMGDKRIGSNVAAITPTLLDTGLNQSTYGAATVGDFLRRDAGYDWGQMQVMNLPAYNVFSVLWGGGSTVSITTVRSNGEDGGWLAEKMREYYSAPCLLR